MSTASGQIDRDQIHLGFWINWARGHVRGATITITRRNGDLLIAFLALFTAMVGKSAWRIACFCIHHALSTSKPQDALYHQRQAILRNSATPVRGIHDFSLALWAWRGRARRSYIRILPIVIFALVTAVAFSVAGIFSSHVADPGNNEVLISSKNCGITYTASTSAADFLTYEVPYTVERAMKASNYALQCYANTSSSSSCKTYVKSKLPRTVSRNASCPFDDSLCMSESDNIRIDTGYLDSLTDLGVNGPPEYRFLYRFVYHCAPLVTDGYSKAYDPSNSSATIPVMRYFYGKPEVTTHVNSSFTYQYPLNVTTKLDTHIMGHSAASDYSVDTVTAYATDNPQVVSYFTPIPQLQRNDADVSLLFLSANGVRFMTPTDDPWYSAHRPGPEAGVTGTNATQDGINRTEVVTYISDKPVGVLGCARQFQLCNPALPEDKRCIPLGSADMNETAYLNLWSDDFQKNLIDFTASVLEWQIFVEEVLRYLGSTALTARYRLQSGLQGPLPADQWKADVEYWHAISLATLQAALVEVATGPSDASMMQFLSPPTAPEEKHFCANQKVLSTNFSSFSVLGLGILLGVGSLIILLDYTLDAVVMLVQERRNKLTYSRLEWRSNSTLQLQRLAHEARGYGTWSKATSMTPVTKRGEHLSVLNMQSPQHPVLMGRESDGLATDSTLDEETPAVSPVMKKDSLHVDIASAESEKSK